MPTKAGKSCTAGGGSGRSSPPRRPTAATVSASASTAAKTADLPRKIPGGRGPEGHRRAEAAGRQGQVGHRPADYPGLGPQAAKRRHLNRPATGTLPITVCRERPLRRSVWGAACRCRPPHPMGRYLTGIFHGLLVARASCPCLRITRARCPCHIRRRYWLMWMTLAGGNPLNQVEEAWL